MKSLDYGFGDGQISIGTTFRYLYLSVLYVQMYFGDIVVILFITLEKLDNSRFRCLRSAKTSASPNTCARSVIKPRSNHIQTHIQSYSNPHITLSQS